MAQPAEITSETPSNGGDVEKEEQPTLKVKQEPGSDDHLRQLLEKKKTTTTSVAAVTGATTTTSAKRLRLEGGQTNITSYFSKTNAISAVDTTAVSDGVGEKKDDDEKNRIDLESIKGVFGWTTLEGVHVPYILRLEEKFTAVRIIEKSLLKKFLQALPPDVYSCTYIKSYFITDNEAKLLNEINMKHCDRQFGHELFTVKDLVVQLVDVVQLYKFLSTCYAKLICSATIRDKENPCGIVRIGGSPIPYVCRDGVKYVPLALFGQEVQSLETKGEKIEPWEVSYIKFCCKVANISNEFLQEHGSLVVSLDDVRQLASSTVSFEDWWPSVHENRVVNKIHRNGTGLMMACLMRNNGDHHHNHQGRNGNPKEPVTSSNANVLPCAVPASGYYDENGAASRNTHKEPAGSRPRAVHTTTNIASNKIPTTTTDNVTNRIQETLSPPSFATVAYPFASNAVSQSAAACGLIPSPVAVSHHHHHHHNPQPYIFNGQWWGPFVSRSAASDGHAFSTSSILPYESWAAHCPQGPTQCSPGGGGGNSSELQHNPIAQYVQSIGQMMKSSGHQPPYNWPLSLDLQQRYQPSTNSSDSAFLMTSRSATSNNSISHKTSVVASEKNRHSNWSLDTSTHSNGHWSNVLSKLPLENSRSPRHISGNSNTFPSTSKVATTHSNGSITLGNPRSAESVRHSSNHCSLSNAAAYERGLSLVQHLTRPGEVAGGQAASSHRHVVAPGSAHGFAVASKMSSPKPANQVPTSVASSDSRERHSVASWQPLTPATDTGTSTTHLNQSDSRHRRSTSSSSKLQELLCSAESNTSSSRTTGIDLSTKSVQSKTPPHSSYKIHDVIVGGIRFHGVNSVANVLGTAIMVPVKELEKNLSPHVSGHLCEHILTKILQVSLFECNRAQEEVLRKVLRYGMSDHAFPTKLISLEDLTRHLPQIVYALAKLQIQGQLETTTKRQHPATNLKQASANSTDIGNVLQLGKAIQVAIDTGSFCLNKSFTWPSPW